jgi:hypothetical protein
MSQVFISYAREDIDKAKEVWSNLYNAGVRGWLDVHEIKGGQQWLEVIEQALWQSSHVILLLSKKSTSKWGFIQKEIRLAIEAYKRVPPGEVFLIPCRLELCEPRHRELRDLHWIDLFPSFEVGFRQLLYALDVDIDESEEAQHAPRKALDVREYRVLFDRPAFSKPCIFEMAVSELAAALDDVSTALATGTCYSRSGNLLRNIVPISMIEDEKLRETLVIVKDTITTLKRDVLTLEEALTSAAVASAAHWLAEYRSHFYMEDYLVRLHEAGVGNDKIDFLIQLMDGIDDSRNQIIYQLNELFQEAGISRIPPVRRSSEQIALSEKLSNIYNQGRDVYGLYYVAAWENLKPLITVADSD